MLIDVAAEACVQEFRQCWSDTEPPGTKGTTQLPQTPSENYSPGGTGRPNSLPEPTSGRTLARRFRAS